MEDHYKTLLTIFNICRDDPQPSTYKCRPREIILRQFQNWNIIEDHLKLLQEESLVSIRQEDTMVINITGAGINKIADYDELLHTKQ